MTDNFRDYSKSGRNGNRSRGSSPQARQASGKTADRDSELKSVNIYKKTTRPSPGTVRPPVKKSNRRRKRRQTLSLIALLVITVLIIILSVILIRHFTDKPSVVVGNPTVDVFKEGITVNGFDISGKTIEEARAVISPSIQQDIDKIGIRLEGEGFSEVITGEQLNAFSNLDEVLNDAFSGKAHQSYGTTISLNYDSLQERIAEINASLTQGATNATFTIEKDSKGRPKINYIEGTPGIGINVDETEQLVTEALNNGDFGVTLSPVLSYVQPAITVETLKKQMTERGRFTTTFCARRSSDEPEEVRQIEENRAYNVEKAADIIDGYVLEPGKTFSFNKVVGDRDEKNGWREAKGIYGGESYNMQYGGGVCQVSTTLYVSVIQAGIPFSSMTRRHHSIPSTYVDKGMDATVDTDHIDFKFKNTTNHNLYIFTYITVTKDRSRYRDLTIVIYGEALPEGTTYRMRSVIVNETEPGNTIIQYDKHQPVDYMVETVAAHNGYEADVYVDTLVNGSVVSSEKLYTDEYEPITQKITMGTITPSPEPTSLPTATPAVTPAPHTEDLP